jgi:hypothetical protein
MFQSDSYVDLLEGDKDLGMYQMIRCSKIHNISSHVVVFPCTKSIS